MEMKQIWLRLVIFSSLFVAPATFAQSPSEIAQQLSDPVFMYWVADKEIGKCIRCHYAGPNIAEIAGRSANTEFSRRKEMAYWVNLDKHTIARRCVEPFSIAEAEQELNALFERINAQADKAIASYRERGVKVDERQVGLESVPKEWIGASNILSRRICDKLSYEYDEFRDNCLTCHGGYRLPVAGAAGGVTNPDLVGFNSPHGDLAKIGIDCMYCHQHQDGKKNWIRNHTSAEDWRLLPQKDKETAGLRNLVKTSRQADLCFDCHIGNRDKNMFVTHEMYAAGHPPIPAIELQKFSEQMPQHWRTPSDLYDALKENPDRDEYFRINYPGVLRDNGRPVFWNTRKMLLGALVARRKSLDLFIDSVGPGKWADYSLYDCSACHHELAIHSKRRRRGYSGAPGRPREHEWPAAILDLAYRLSERQAFEKSQHLEQELASFFSETPFGDPEIVAHAAVALREFITTQIEIAERRPVDARIARAMLRRLASTPEEKLLTYDSARQVVWAMQTIATEFAKKKSPLDPQAVEIIESLGKPKMTGVDANIPSGRKQFIYPKSLKKDLALRADFDPARLKGRLSQIHQKLTP
jgi:hypothetical protein